MGAKFMALYNYLSIVQAQATFSEIALQLDRKAQQAGEKVERLVGYVDEFVDLLRLAATGSADNQIKASALLDGHSVHRQLFKWADLQYTIDQHRMANNNPLRYAPDHEASFRHLFAFSELASHYGMPTRHLRASRTDGSTGYRPNAGERSGFTEGSHKYSEAFNLQPFVVVGSGEVSPWGPTQQDKEVRETANAQLAKPAESPPLEQLYNYLENGQTRVNFYAMISAVDDYDSIIDKGQKAQASGKKTEKLADYVDEFMDLLRLAVKGSAQNQQRAITLLKNSPIYGRLIELAEANNMLLLLASNTPQSGQHAASYSNSDSNPIHQSRERLGFWEADASNAFIFGFRSFMPIYGGMTPNGGAPMSRTNDRERTGLMEWHGMPNKMADYVAAVHSHPTSVIQASLNTHPQGTRLTPSGESKVVPNDVQIAAIMDRVMLELRKHGLSQTSETVVKVKDYLTLPNRPRPTPQEFKRVAEWVKNYVNPSHIRTGLLIRIQLLAALSNLSISKTDSVKSASAGSSSTETTHGADMSFNHDGGEDALLSIRRSGGSEDDSVYATRTFDDNIRGIQSSRKKMLNGAVEYSITTDSLARRLHRQTAPTEKRSTGPRTQATRAAFKGRGARTASRANVAARRRATQQGHTAARRARMHSLRKSMRTSRGVVRG